MTKVKGVSTPGQTQETTHETLTKEEADRRIKQKECVEKIVNSLFIGFNFIGSFNLGNLPFFPSILGHAVFRLVAMSQPDQKKYKTAMAAMAAGSLAAAVAVPYAFYFNLAMMGSALVMRGAPHLFTNALQ